MAYSFRGIPFQVISSPRSGGRRLVVHEFPFNDVPFVEDIGKKLSTYSIEGYVVGDDWESKRDDLIDALNVDGAGTLIHTDFGTLEVKVDSWSTSESRVSGIGKCEFEVEFIEVGSSAAVVTLVDTQTRLFNASNIGMTTIVDAFKLVYNVSSNSGFISATIDQAVSTLKDQLVNSTSLEVLKAMDALSLVDVSNTIAFGDAILNLFQVKSSDLAVVRGNIPTTTTITTTPNRILQHQSEKQVINLIDNLSLITQVMDTSQLEFETYEDAIEKRDELSVILDEQMVKVATELDTYTTLSTIKTNMIIDANTRAPELSRLITRDVGGVRPALVLAYDFYEDATREDEVISRNNVTNPALISGKVEYIQ